MQQWMSVVVSVPVREDARMFCLVVFTTELVFYMLYNRLIKYKGE